jgi:hypothetical protein
MENFMNAGRELDERIAKEVLGNSVARQKREVYESTPKGTRPLRSYSTDIEAAWEVAQAMAISIVPIENKEWFAFVGRSGGWKSPAEFLEALSTAEFMESGAAVSPSAALSICLAALRAVEKRRHLQ